METATVKHIRDNIYRKCTFTLHRRSDGSKATFSPIIHICCDNSLNCYASEAEFVDPDGTVHKDNSNIIWDDENEMFYWLKGNTPSTLPNSPANSMSQGTKSDFPLAVIAVDYGEIQNIRIILNEEAYWKFCDIMGDLMSEEQKNNIYRLFFEETDMYTVITRKREMNYVSRLPNKYDKKYNEDSSYDYAIHADSGGGV